MSTTKQSEKLRVGKLILALDNAAETRKTLESEIDSLRRTNQDLRALAQETLSLCQWLARKERGEPEPSKPPKDCRHEDSFGPFMDNAELWCPECGSVYVRHGGGMKWLYTKP